MRRAWVLIALTATDCGATHAGKPGPPTSFAPNRGQFAPDVRFAAQGEGYQLAATDGGLELALSRGERVRVAIPGHPRPGARLPGTANHLLGSDPRAWRTRVPTYREVVYRDAWPGIDVAVHGTAGRSSTTCASPPAPIPGRSGSTSASPRPARATARCRSAP